MKINRLELVSEGCISSTCVLNLKLVLLGGEIMPSHHLSSLPKFIVNSILSCEVLGSISLLPFPCDLCAQAFNKK